MDALDPKTTIRVAVTGNDAADGMAAPVKTLKRGIELAKANGAIKAISLEAGTYGAANGESYPYTVPANVIVVGAAGTILAGTTAEDGLVIETGSLTNLELNAFKTAIHATVSATLTNITVKTSWIGVLSTGAAKVTASRITFVGTQCPDTGLWAKDSSQITADTFVATGSIAVNVADQSSVSVANGSITEAPSCARITATGKSLVIANTQITGSTGIDLGGSQLEVTLENTTVADAVGDAIQGHAHSFHMTGGELRNNGRGGAELNSGSYTFTNVGIKGNPVFGIYLQNGTDPGTMTMRGCTISGNGNGVYLFAGATGDFGTAAAPGNNTFRGNDIGLDIDTSPSAVTAVGNTWKSNVQGADSDGKYPSQLKVGPVPYTAGNNFKIAGSSTLQL